MTTETKAHLSPDAQPQCSPCDGSFGDIFRDLTPRSDRTQMKRLETSDEIARALHIAPTLSERSSRRVVVVLVALVVMCLVMAAIVWWRLLT